MWTHFWDMHSGGNAKVNINGMDKTQIFVEGDDAIEYFTEVYGDPNAECCPTCGPNYSIDDNESLEKLSEYHRNHSVLRPTSDNISLKDFEALDYVIIVRLGDRDN